MKTKQFRANMFFLSSQYKKNKQGDRNAIKAFARKELGIEEEEDAEQV